jgi:hypothetical protein
MAKTLYINNGMLLKVSSLMDQSNSSYVTNATVLATLKTASDTNVTGQTWPLTLTHQSSGTYQGILEGDLDVSGAYYNLEITVNSGSASQASWDIDVKAERRR